MYTSMVSNYERREFLLKQFLQGLDIKGKPVEGGPKTFGEIFQYLQAINHGYKQKKGLVNKLRTLEKKGEIEKIKQKPYPVYAIKKDALLDFAIAGQQFQERIIMPMMGPLIGLDEKYWNEPRSSVSLERIDPHDSYETKLVKNLVARYGFYLLLALIKDLEYWLLKTNGSIKQVQARTIWLNHALDFSKYQPMIFRQFLNLLSEHTIEEDELSKYNKKTRARIKKVKKVIAELYPKSYPSILGYEYYYEKRKGTINRLKTYEDVMKDLKV